MSSDGNLRYAVYLNLSFSSALKEIIKVLFKLRICFLKEIYSGGKLVTSTKIFHQSQWIDRCRLGHLLLYDSIPSKTGSDIELKLSKDALFLKA